MLGRLFLLFVLIPLIELVLLSQLLLRTGLPVTLLVVLVTGVVGVSLTRQQGLKAWRAVHSQLAQGKSPTREIVDGVMILFAGAFLITPGLLTDCVGFSLLLPPVRNQIGRWLTRWFRSRTTATFQTAKWSGTDFASDFPEENEAPSVRVVVPDDETMGIKDQTGLR